jgi:hypothetical protein
MVWGMEEWLLKARKMVGSGEGRIYGAWRKVERQVKVLIKNFAIFFLFPSKQFLLISLKIQQLVILCNI